VFEAAIMAKTTVYDEIVIENQKKETMEIKEIFT